MEGRHPARVSAMAWAAKQTPQAAGLTERYLQLLLEDLEVHPGQAAGSSRSSSRGKKGSSR